MCYHCLFNTQNKSYINAVYCEHCADAIADRGEVCKFAHYHKEVEEAEFMFEV